MGAARDWYEENIEEGVRDVVRLLRDNGFNTTHSCHHDMFVQLDAAPFVGGLPMEALHTLLYNYLRDRKEPVSFEVEVRHKVHGGCIMYTHATVLLTGRKKHPKDGDRKP